jgi:hypothetical protein
VAEPEISPGLHLLQSAGGAPEFEGEALVCVEIFGGGRHAEPVECIDDGLLAGIRR